MLRRIIKWVFGLTIFLAIVVFVVLPLVANTEQGRKQLAKLMSKALDREVTIGGLDVGFFFRSVDIEDLAVANPAGFPEGNMIEATSLSMDASLRKLIGGTLKSGLTGRGLKLHVIRKDGKSNMDGFGGPPKKDDEKHDAPDMDLELDLEDGSLTVEDLDKGERMHVSGVSMKMRLTNMGDVATAGLTITVASVDNKTLRVRDLVLDTRLEGEHLEINELSAILPGKGTLGGSGRMRVKNGPPAWNLKLAMKSVGIDGDMMPFVASVYPMAASAGGQVDGTLDGAFELAGIGLTWKKIKPGLTGTGNVTLSDLRLPQDSIISQITALAGGKAGGLTLNATGAEFAIRDGFLHFNRLSARGGESRYDFAGKVSLDGELALEYDLLPLVKQLGGGKAYAGAAQYVDKLPVRIVGSAGSPRLKAPKVDDIAKGALRKGVGGLLDKIKKK